MTPAAEFETQVTNKLLDFFETMNYDDVLVEIDHFDHYTDQVFVTSVGNWTEERRQLLQSHLKQSFRKLGVSTIIYGGVDELWRM